VRNLVSGLATIALAAGGMVLVVNHLVIGTNPVAIGVQIAGVVLMVWARITFGLRSFHATAAPTAGGLVTTGPYRFIRNPIYAAVLLVFGAAIACHLSLLTVVVGAVIVAGTAVRIASEESLLRAAFPDYDAYARRTARLVPFVL
jgi:protein-S-isoprenylcysteine O-methyltransferase Ste14